MSFQYGTPTKGSPKATTPAISNSHTDGATEYMSNESSGSNQSSASNPRLPCQCRWMVQTIQCLHRAVHSCLARRLLALSLALDPTTTRHLLTSMVIASTATCSPNNSTRHKLVSKCGSRVIDHGRCDEVSFSGYANFYTLV